MGVEAGAERTDDDIRAGDGAVDGVGVGQLADDHADAVAPFGRDFVGVAGVGGDGVPVGKELVDGEGSDGAGGAEDGDVHTGWCSCSRVRMWRTAGATMSPNCCMESRTIWCGMPPRSTWPRNRSTPSSACRSRIFSAICAGPPAINAPPRAARLAIVGRSTCHPRPPLVSGER